MERKVNIPVEGHAGSIDLFRSNPGLILAQRTAYVKILYEYLRRHPELNVRSGGIDSNR